MIKILSSKRQPPLRQTGGSGTKNPKHISVLIENRIDYEQPLNPIDVAANRAERIMREKKQNQVATVS